MILESFRKLLSSYKMPEEKIKNLFASYKILAIGYPGDDDKTESKDYPNKIFIYDSNDRGLKISNKLEEIIEQKELLQLGPNILYHVSRDYGLYSKIYIISSKEINSDEKFKGHICKEYVDEIRDNELEIILANHILRPISEAECMCIIEKTENPEEYPDILGDSWYDTIN